MDKTKLIKLKINDKFHCLTYLPLEALIPLFVLKIISYCLIIISFYSSIWS